MISVKDMVPGMERQSIEIKRESFRISSLSGLGAPNGALLRFRDCFWGEKSEGYEVLSEKAKKGLSVFKQLIVFFENFVKLEEAHGKALVKLTQASHKGMGRDPDFQSLHDCLLHMNDCRYDQLGKAYQLLASRLSEELQALKTFRAEQKAIKRREDEAMRRAVKLLDREASNVEKANAHYNTRHRDLVRLQETMKKSHADANLSQKDLAKLQEKLSKATKEAEKASASYKLSVLRWNEVRHAWEERMLAACDAIQSMEQQRISFIKARLQKLVAFQEESTMNISDEILRGIAEKIEKIDPALDLQNFVNHHATGTEKPSRLTYVDFFANEKSKQAEVAQTSTIIVDDSVANDLDRAPLETPSSSPLGKSLPDSPETDDDDTSSLSPEMGDLSSSPINARLSIPSTPETVTDLPSVAEAGPNDASLSEQTS